MQIYQLGSQELLLVTEDNRRGLCNMSGGASVSMRRNSTHAAALARFLLLGRSGRAERVLGGCIALESNRQASATVIVLYAWSEKGVELTVASSLGRNLSTSFLGSLRQN